MQMRLCGRVVLIMDLVIKLGAMMAYGVLVGFAIRDAVANAGKPIFELVAQVCSSGVMGFFLCLATAVFEVSRVSRGPFVFFFCLFRSSQLSFLVWRGKSVSAEYHELAVNSEQVWK